MEVGEASDRSSNVVGNKLFTFVHLVSAILDGEILEKKLYLKEPERFYYTLLHKVRNILDAGSFLITNLDGKPHYTDSAFLLLRTCMLDIANIYFVMDATDDTEAQAERINRIMFDHIRAIYTAAKDNPEERDAIRTTYPICFNGEKFRKDIKKVGIIDMFGELRNQNVKAEYEFLILYYNIFSKIEHNGILSFDLLHAPFYLIGGMRAKNKIYEAIATIMIAINLLVNGIWIGENDPRLEQMREITNDILGIEWPELKKKRNNPDEPNRDANGR